MTELPGEAEVSETWPSTLVASVALSVLAGSASLAASSRHPLLAAFLLFTAADSLFNQGLLAVFLLGDGQLPCRLLAASCLFFTVLQLSFMASLALFPSVRLSPYLYYLLPFALALCITMPFLFPQVAPVNFFHGRQNCGFVNVSRTHSIITLVIGFIFPLCTLYYFSTKIYYPLYKGVVTKNEKIVIILISVCSVLLIPHIIEVNIAHFSANDLKSNVESGTNSSNIYEILFIWLRYVFDAIIPLVIFLAERDALQEWKRLYYLCFKSNSVAKYMKQSKSKTIQKNTPILFATKDGLVLKINDTIKDIEIPYNSDGFKVDSSMSAGTSSLSIEKNAPGKKKIVRFAHSVKEISMKAAEWDSNSE